MSQINPVHILPADLTSVLMLSSPYHLCLGFPNGLFPSGLPTKTLYTPLLSPHTCYMPRASHSFIIWSPAKYLVSSTDQNSSLCGLLYSPVTSSLLGPKYPPQHPILEHPQLRFFPQCERSSFTPIQNSRQNYSCVEDRTHVKSVLQFFLTGLSRK